MTKQNTLNKLKARTQHLIEMNFVANGIDLQNAAYSMSSYEKTGEALTENVFKFINVPDMNNINEYNILCSGQQLIGEHFVNNDLHEFSYFFNY